MKPKTKTSFTAIFHPIFLLSLGLLILNDCFFKELFHNGITGKLSDFAGLLAFPFFFGILFPKHRKSIHILTALGFVFWKSTYSQGLIDQLNLLGGSFYRTVDFTDNIALLSTLTSYYLLKKDQTLLNIFFQNFSLFKPSPFIQNGLAYLLILVACWAFMATSQIRPFNITWTVNKEYPFDCSKEELISRLNMVQLDYIRSVNDYGLVDFNSETNTFSYRNRTDTLALLLDPQKVADQDTIQFRTSYVAIQLSGNEETSTLKLIQIFGNPIKYHKKNTKAERIKEFEKHIIKKMRKMKK